MLADPGLSHALRRCVDHPDDVAGWLALAERLARAGEAREADQAYAQADRLMGDPVGFAMVRAEAAVAAGAGARELDRLLALTGADPLSVPGWAAMATVLERSGRRAEAIDALEAAVALDPCARRPVALLGALLARSGRLREAEAALRSARALDPDNALLANDEAAVLLRLHRPSEARDALRALALRDPPETHVLCNLSGATVVLGLQDEAIAVARSAIALDPGSMQAWRGLCNALPYRDGTTGADLLTALRDCALRLPREPAPAWSNVPVPGRRLRLGLLGGSLREHPVGWLTVAGFEALDPARFELIVFAQADCGDAIARRFRAIAAEWHAVDGLEDADLATLARARNIDVLIDLGGYGDNARMAATVRRLAPVQVKWVGMQYHSTGIPEMDWFITDRWQTPSGHAPLYSERLLRMPDGYVCYSPPADAPDVESLPASLQDYVTFGCFNNLAKVTPRVIQTWARVLHLVPGSRMILKMQPFRDPAVCDRVRAAFAGHGIAAERLELRPGSAHRAFLAEYGDVDIVLDPFPYSGGLTTCEALWMGVPVVALAGGFFAARHSVSHLSNVGLADWVADDVDGYVALAVARAGDVAALAALRAGLRARMAASPLCDARRFGRNLGAALRGAWTEWCDTREAS